jgi:hypothetical protein
MPWASFIPCTDQSTAGRMASSPKTQVFEMVIKILFWACIGDAAASFAIGNDIHFAGELVPLGSSLSRRSLKSVERPLEGKEHEY